MQDYVGSDYPFGILSIDVDVGLEGKNVRWVDRWCQRKELAEVAGPRARWEAVGLHVRICSGPPMFEVGLGLNTRQ